MPPGTKRISVRFPGGSHGRLWNSAASGWSAYRRQRLGLVPVVVGHSAGGGHGRRVHRRRSRVVAPPKARDDVLLNVGAIVTTSAQAAALRAAVGSFEGRRLHLVQFAGPIRPEWHEDLEATGADVIQYIPSYAYLVYGDAVGPVPAAGDGPDLGRRAVGRRLPRPLQDPARGPAGDARQARPAGRPGRVRHPARRGSGGQRRDGEARRKSGRGRRAAALGDPRVRQPGRDAASRRGGSGRGPARRGLDRSSRDPADVRRAPGPDPLGPAHGQRPDPRRLPVLPGRQGLHPGAVRCFGVRRGRQRQRHRQRHDVAQPLRPARGWGARQPGPRPVQPPRRHGALGQHSPGLRRPRQPQLAHRGGLRAGPGDAAQPGDARGHLRLPLRPRRLPVREGGLVGHLRPEHLHEPQPAESAGACLRRRRAHLDQQLGREHGRRLRRGSPDLRRARSRRPARHLGVPGRRQPGDGRGLLRRQRRHVLQHRRLAGRGEERDHGGRLGRRPGVRRQRQLRLR